MASLKACTNLQTRAFGSPLATGRTRAAAPARAVLVTRAGALPVLNPEVVAKAVRRTTSEASLKGVAAAAGVLAVFPQAALAADATTQQIKYGGAGALMLVLVANSVAFLTRDSGVREGLDAMQESKRETIAAKTEEAKEDLSKVVESKQAEAAKVQAEEDRFAAAWEAAQARKEELQKKQ